MRRTNHLKFMNLTIDIGNTRTKIALFDGETFVREEKFENTDAEHLLNVVKEKKAEGLAASLERKRAEAPTYQPEVEPFTGRLF